MTMGYVIMDKNPPMNTSIISVEELREICEMTVKLTKVSQDQCKLLTVENIAPELFSKLLTEISMHKRGLATRHPSLGLMDIA